MRTSLTYLDGPTTDLLENSWVLPGTVCVSGATRPNFYAEHALIPRFAAAVPLTSEVIHMKREFSWGGDEVAIFDLDPDSQRIWKDFWESTTKMDPPQIHKHSLAERLLKETYDRVHHRMELEDGTTSLGFVINHPRMRTTTVDVKRGELCGLHFDSWESRTTEDRLAARKRISINLGPGPRWFLFVPRKLSSLAAELPEEFRDVPDPTLKIIAQFSEHPERLSCVALCVAPGQAYIAPTESVMHDATSFWSDRVNFSAQFFVRPSNAHTPR
jgi:hypothetical protein